MEWSVKFTLPMPFEECEITLEDGYRAYSRYWPVSTPKGAVLYLHGIQSHCGWYERSAAHLQQAGYAVLQPDRRGSGRNCHERGHLRDVSQIASDTQICGDALLRRCGLDQFHILGISWGGKQAAASYATDQSRVASLMLICPGLFPQVDLPGYEKVKIGLAMLHAPQRYFDIPLNDPSLFTASPEWIQFLQQDALRLHQVTAAFFLAGRRMDAWVRKLRKTEPVPLFLALASNDVIIDSDRTQRFANTLEWPGTRIVRYANARHTLEFEPCFQEYCSDLTDWLNLQ